MVWLIVGHLFATLVDWISIGRLSSREKDLEILLLRRQKGKCPLCGESLFNDEFYEEHPIVRRDEGGSDTLDSLVILYLFCHQQMTAQQRQEHRKKSQNMAQRELPFV